MSEAATTYKAAQLVSAQEVRGATVKLGWFHRERVFVYGYDDGRYVVGYPLRVDRGSYVVVGLAEVPWPDREAELVKQADRIAWLEGEVAGWRIKLAECEERHG